MSLLLTPENTLPIDGVSGTLIGRAWVPGAIAGPSLIVLRGDGVFDQVFGRTAGLGPGRHGLRTRQEEVATRQGGRRRQALFELQHRDALASRGGRAGVFLAAAQTRQWEREPQVRTLA